jgi:hypothetical protein
MTSMINSYGMCISLSAFTVSRGATQSTYILRVPQCTPLVGIGTSPQPPTRRLVCPLPPVSGGRGTLSGEKGGGRVPIPTKGIHCGTLYMYVLCGELDPYTDYLEIERGTKVKKI